MTSLPLTDEVELCKTIVYIDKDTPVIGFFLFHKLCEGPEKGIWPMINPDTCILCSKKFDIDHTKLAGLRDILTLA